VVKRKCRALRGEDCGSGALFRLTARITRNGGALPRREDSAAPASMRQIDDARAFIGDRLLAASFARRSAASGGYAVENATGYNNNVKRLMR
jgi:hypothetical protein